MKSSFGRSFFAIATILLLSLVLLGTSFQMLINDYMTENTISGLKQDGQILADLAAAYSIDGSLGSREFMLNLDIATQISSFDAVICDVDGDIVICSCYPNLCDHIGWRIDRDYMARVLNNGGDGADGQRILRGARHGHLFLIADAEVALAHGNQRGGRAFGRLDNPDVQPDRKSVV